MLQHSVPVLSNRCVAEHTWSLTFHSPAIAALARPGQFVNIRVADAVVPLLRRPFSVSWIDGGTIGLLFTVVGPGTQMLSDKRPGDSLDVIGPLGKPFIVDGMFDTALIAAGGVGIAPFPFLARSLEAAKKEIVSFVGARTSGMLATEGLTSPHIATDDGSAGMRGTVVDLLGAYLDSHTIVRPKIFGCGPTAMLKALSRMAAVRKIPCELSLEGAMACGIGICQGCPVKRSSGEKAYALACTDGPTFDSSSIILD